MIRIIGGDWKGHGLRSPEGSETRPTSAFLREVIFNVLNNAESHQYLRVLDLFAGTGALGLEALSQGAETAVFVESSQRALKCLQRNITELAKSKRCHVIQNDNPIQWEKALLQQRDFTPFDLVFCDPPYNKNWILKAFKHLKKPELWAKNAILVAEMAPRENVEIPEWEAFKEKLHGDSKVVFFRRSLLVL